MPIENRFSRIDSTPLTKNRLQQKILNILSHLSQSLLKNKDLFYDAEEIWEELMLSGFTDEEIESALSYIERTSLKVPGPFWSSDIPTFRNFTNEESSRLTPKARGYLWTLKSRGIIDHALEDEILEKAMNLEDRAGVREIRTVAALTIFGYEHGPETHSLDEQPRSSRLH